MCAHSMFFNIQFRIEIFIFHKRGELVSFGMALYCLETFVTPLLVHFFLNEGQDFLKTLSLFSHNLFTP